MEIASTDPRCRQRIWTSTVKLHRIFVQSKEQHRTHRSFQNGQLEIMHTLSSVTRICRGGGADSVRKRNGANRGLLRNEDPKNRTRTSENLQTMTEKILDHDCQTEIPLENWKDSVRPLRRLQFPQATVQVRGTLTFCTAGVDNTSCISLTTTAIKSNVM